MVRKSLLAASLALLAVGVGRPAKADAKFLEAYPDIFGARTLLGSPSDPRPKDAIQNQETGEGNARKSAFIVGAFGRFASGEHTLPFTAVGGGLGYTSVSGSHPWEVKIGGYDFNPHSLAPGINPAGRLGLDATAKIIAWQPAQSYLPVVSLVGRYRNINDFFHRWDGTIAFDEKVMKSVYVTGNVGYGSTDFVRTSLLGFGAPEKSGITAGAGLTWAVSRKLSLAGNYVGDTAVEPEDFWSAAITYAANNDLSFSAGGGKHKTFFGQLIYKFGKRGESTAAAQQK